MTMRVAILKKIHLQLQPKINHNTFILLSMRLSALYADNQLKKKRKRVFCDKFQNVCC